MSARPDTWCWPEDQRSERWLNGGVLSEFGLDLVPGLGLQTDIVSILVLYVLYVVCFISESGCNFPSTSSRIPFFVLL